MAKTQRLAWLLALPLLFASCGDDDSDGGSGASGGGAGAGGSSGAAGMAGAIDAGTDDADAGNLCKATENPYNPEEIDCQAACDHFLLWCDASSPCASPYCDNPADCPTACVVTKATTPYVNAQWGCAAANGVCEQMLECLATLCEE